MRGMPGGMCRCGDARSLRALARQPPSLTTPAAVARSEVKDEERERVRTEGSQRMDWLADVCRDQTRNISGVCAGLCARTVH